MHIRKYIFKFYSTKFSRRENLSANLKNITIGEIMKKYKLFFRVTVIISQSWESLSLELEVRPKIKLVFVLNKWNQANSLPFHVTIEYAA